MKGEIRPLRKLAVPFLCVFLVVFGSLLPQRALAADQIQLIRDAARGPGVGHDQDEGLGHGEPSWRRDLGCTGKRARAGSVADRCYDRPDFGRYVERSDDSVR